MVQEVAHLEGVERRGELDIRCLAQANVIPELLDKAEGQAATGCQEEQAQRVARENDGKGGWRGQSGMSS